MSAQQRHYEHYAALIERLKEIISISEHRITQESPDPLLLDNVNFFTKAYLISLCTYLEAFLQDVAFSHISRVQSRLAAARVPHNVVHWAVLANGVKDGSLAFRDFALPLSRKDLADELSGNPGKTIVLFRKIGVDLRSSAMFNGQKDIVGSIVTKRNNIIHHNNSAADVSMKDLRKYADEFLVYMRAIEEAASSA